METVESEVEGDETPGRVGEWTGQEEETRSDGGNRFPRNTGASIRGCSLEGVAYGDGEGRKVERVETDAAEDFLSCSRPSPYVTLPIAR